MPFLLDDKTAVKEEVKNKKKAEKNNLEITVDGFRVYVDEDGAIITDMVLLKRLQKVRIKIGDEKNTPYYIIATNKVLVRLATEKPTTREGFINIKGIRDRWFDNNGQAFLQEIKDYLENH
jgi:superfamily II DNA helicase RecQ